MFNYPTKITQNQKFTIISSSPIFIIEEKSRKSQQLFGTMRSEGIKHMLDELKSAEIVQIKVQAASRDRL